MQNQCREESRHGPHECARHIEPGTVIAIRWGWKRAGWRAAAEEEEHRTGLQRCLTMNAQSSPGCRFRNTARGVP